MNKRERMKARWAMIRSRKLRHPKGWSMVSDVTKRRMVNGCGAKGAWYNFLIPDNLLGTDIYPACAVHDVCYGMGLCTKPEADAMFLDNMLALCLQDLDARAAKLHVKHCRGLILFPWATLFVLRAGRALVYYLAVCLFGDAAYNHKSGRRAIHPQVVYNG